MDLWVLKNSSVGKDSACNEGDPGSIPRSGRSAGEGMGYPLQYSWASLVAQLAKNLPVMWETWVWSLGWEDPLDPKSMYAQVANVKWAVCKNRGQTLVRHGLPCFLSKAIEPVGKEVRERKNFMSLVSQQIKITVIKHLAPTYWAAPWTYSRSYNLHQWGGPLLQIRKLRPFNADKVTHFTQLKSNAMWTCWQV